MKQTQKNYRWLKTTALLFFAFCFCLLQGGQYAIAQTAEKQEQEAKVRGGPWYALPCGVSNTVTEGQDKSGKIPAGGIDVGASYYGGEYRNGQWVPTNGIQGGGNDDPGIGNVNDPKTGKPVQLPGRTAYAELSTNYNAPLNQLDFAALGKLKPFTKLAITYKGKTVVAEKLDVGGGGPSTPAMDGKPRAIDLWWETARLLDFKEGEGVVHVNLVDASTPVTPIDGKAVDNSNKAEAAAACCAEAGGSLFGKDNPQKAFNYFISKGLKDFQSAGVVGNLMHESGVNPKSEQIGGGPGRGIAQWSAGGRWEKLKEFAKDKSKNGVADNRDIYDLATQLDFIWYEMTKVPPWKDTLEPLKNAKSLEIATFVFEDGYEKAGAVALDSRISKAKTVLKKYGATKVDQNGNSVTGTGCPGGGVNAEGYAYPVAPQRKSQNSGSPGLSPMPCPGICHHDGTPALDIGRKPGGNAIVGTPVYAIYDGVVDNMHTRNFPHCYSLHVVTKEKDGKWDYWYGHIFKPKVKNGQKVKAGQQLAEIGTNDCADFSTPHLHIDRGCNHQPGGSVGCRDRGFIPLINSIFNSLPN